MAKRKAPAKTDSSLSVATEDSTKDSQAEADETHEQPEAPVEVDFILPSLSLGDVLEGKSYTYHSEIPSGVLNETTESIILGVDEAGRGPVLGPMVYGIAYCLRSYDESLRKHGYDDSKKLTTDYRAKLVKDLCTPSTEAASSIGWAVRVMSPRDIASGMLRPAGTGAYNLNAQAHDATIQLIKEVLAKGVNVKDIYVDTVGPPASYQAKLARIFPICSVTVAKKADSIYPSVSVASVVAKVIRDVVLESSISANVVGGPSVEAGEALPVGSGYPSDPKTIAWLKQNMDPVFGWGVETRYSWSTVADLLKKEGKAVEWLDEDGQDGQNIMTFFGEGSVGGSNGGAGGLTAWFGRPVADNEF